MVEKKEAKKRKVKLFTKLKKNPWILSTIIFGIVALIFVVGSFASGTISKEKAANQLVESINSNLGLELEVLEVKNYGNNLYEVLIDLDGQEGSVYVTKDGEFYSTSIFPVLDEVYEEEPEVQDIPKSEIPTVELFVMTHCPYGTQAEKGFLPTMRFFGESINAKIRFVHYYMHTNNQEEVETPRQVCIREEQPDKFNAYLECFLGTSAGTPEEAIACESEVGIDSASLAECISSGRTDTYYAEDSALSEEYGVQGSPTLVINGQIVSSGRSPAAFLDTFCQAFLDAPELCSEELDDTNPSTGFGWEGSGSGSNAQC